MSVNLLDLVNGHVGSQIVRQVSDLLGENEAATQKAIDGATPALIGGLMQQASTGEGAKALTGALDKFDYSFLSNLGASLGGGGEKGLIDIGGGLSKMIFGGELGSVTEILGEVSGLGKGSLGSLLGVLAPIVIGVLGQQRKNLSLDASGLTKLLMSQKESISGLLPDGLSETLGLGQVMGSSSAQVASQGARGAVHAGSSGGDGLLRKVIPIALIVGVGYFAYQLMLDQGAKNVEAAIPVDTTAQLTDVFDKFRAALEDIGDAASAESAVPALEGATRELDGITNGFAGLPPDVKSSAGAQISGFLPGLQELLGRVMSIEGVEPIVAPVVGELTEKLESAAR